MKVISLYTGAGGLDLGFERIFSAAEFDRYEVDRAACAALEANGRSVHRVDVGSVECYPSADLVIGGPPCQPFSKANTAKRADDPRRGAWRQFMRAVETSGASAFVFENVPDFRLSVHGTSMVQAAERMGFRITAGVYRADRCGCPTTRRRFIMVGVRTAGEISPLVMDTGCRSVVRDWISMMPEPDTRYADADGMHGWIDSERDRRRASMVPGDVEPLRWIREHVPHLIPPTYRIRDPQFFPRAYKRFEWDAPAGTLTTAFADHSKGQLHPGGRRALTPREAALIQTFPLSWEFRGNAQQVARQIGNAVPPMMAAVIAQNVKERMV